MGRRGGNGVYQEWFWRYFFALFSSYGCFIKGFSHEYPIHGKSADDFYSGIPKEFVEASQEPAFSPNNVSFCCWQRGNQSHWESPIPDNELNPDSFFLLEDLNGDETSYEKFVHEYYEMSSSLDKISAVYQHKPMTSELARSMNPAIEYAKLVNDLIDIGYPVSS